MTKPPTGRYVSPWPLEPPRPPRTSWWQRLRARRAARKAAWREMSRGNEQEHR